MKNGTTPITIRSSSADSVLPAAGQRITPAAAPLLAKIRSTTAGPAMRTDPGATYWTLQFLEFLPSSSTSSANLLEFGGAGTTQNTLAAVPQHLVIDRCYLHGDPGYGQRRGLALNSGDTQILNSYFADFKGVLQDTQAIMGWNGPGPYLIENNYLEAAGENVMFGGSDPSIPNLVPSNITMRRNLISRPLAWMSQNWTVKNLLEFKNAQDVLVEGNIIENHWAAGQSGYAILFTPRNQSGGAPWSVTRNITIRSNIIRHLAAVFNISGWDDINTALQTENITIANNLVYDISTAYNHPEPSRQRLVRGDRQRAEERHLRSQHRRPQRQQPDSLLQRQGAQRGDEDLRAGAHRQQLARQHLRHRRRQPRPGERLVELSTRRARRCWATRSRAGVAKNYPTGNDFPTVAQWLASFTSVEHRRTTWSWRAAC